MKLITLFVLFVHTNSLYNCRNGTVSLKYGEIAFFQIGNYPAISPIRNFEHCKLNFTLNEKMKQDYRLLYNFIEHSNNTDSVYNYYSKNDIILNQSTFLPFIPYNKDALAITQHGYVIFEKNEKCPLESLSSDGNPYQLNDESQILTLTNFAGFDSLVSSCHWRFKGPDGYGFKIWVNEYNLLLRGSVVEFIVKNSTDVFLNHRTVESQLATKSLHPIYNSDNFIDIFFNSTFPSSTSTKLNISISLIKNQPKIFKQICYLANKTNTEPSYSTFYWGISYNHGYSNNAKCEYSFILPNNSLLYVEHGNFSLLNTMGDRIIAYIGEDGYVRDVSNNGQYFIDVGPFKEDKKIKFEFTSDGSFQGLGFLLKIYIHECKCNTKPINCDGSINFYMETSETYCNNLACNFTFSHCTSEESLVTFYETSTFFETFKMYSNGEVQFDFVDYHEYISNFYTIINSSAHNVLEVVPLENINVQNEKKSHPFGVERRFMFDLFITPSDKPVLNVTLSKTAPIPLLDMGLYKRVKFEVSPDLINKNLTFTVSVSDLMYVTNNFFFQLFENKKILLGQKCFGDEDPYICEIKANEFFAVQRNFLHTTSPYLAVQASGEKDDNCIFDKHTVIVLRTYGPKAINKLLNISQIASSKGACVITLLVDLSYDDSAINDKHFYISSLWTTANDKNVKVFFGNKNERNLFFEFNQQNSSNLNYISLNSKAYTFKIPKFASILIQIEQSEGYIPFENFPLSLFQSLLTTPYFGGTKYPSHTSVIDPNHQFYFWGTDCTREITFTILYYDVAYDEEVYFLIDDKVKLPINSSADIITFNKKLKTSRDNSAVFTDNIKLIYDYPPQPRPPRIKNGIIFNVLYSSSIL